MPGEQPKGRAGLIALVGASAAALMTATVATWEGTRLDPYKDIVGKWTVCTGETNVPMRRYTAAECDTMLADSLAGYAEGVLRRNPELRGRPHQLAAAVSLRYNIGGAAYDRSTVARRFSAGNWKAACDAFLMWRFAGGREVKGLLNRRRHERQICLTGLS